MMRVDLSSLEAEYVLSGEVLEAELRTTVKNGLSRERGHFVVELSDDASNAVCIALSDRLAQVGFDASYELTDEGRVLDQLVSRFCGV